MKRSMIIASTLAIAATACSPIVGTGTPALAAGLVAFDECESFLSYVKEQAKEIVTPWGLEGHGNYFGPPVILEGDVAFDGATTTTAPAAGEAPRNAAGGDFSGTNVQVAGVDEPDVIKTDGDRIFAIANGRLYLIDANGSEPFVADSIQLENGWGEMFIAGDRVYVTSNGGGYGIPVEPLRGIAADEYYGGYTAVTSITEIDVSDPASLRLVETLFLDGGYVSARMHGGSVRVVISAQPLGFAWEYPQGGGLFAEMRARDANKRIIDNSTIENWIPYYIVVGPDGSSRDGLLVDCADAYHPVEFSGLGMLTVVTIDAAEGLQPAATVGVLADGQQVYASETSLYVASNQWLDPAELSGAELQSRAGQQRTAIHKFDISDPLATEYRASGDVSGYLLNQFAMDEHQGFLRIATTDAAWWWGVDDDSASRVSVLQERDGELVIAGEVGGLGKGERIYSVRFMGDVGYVVTFRQTDPLYTLDLSDPFNPAAVGELKILGYSAYLHPLGDGLLLGVGQDATDTGRILGTQVSVFDVSDLANPTRLHQYTLESSNSSAEFDHRAFLYWPATSTVVIPISKWSWDERSGTEDYFAGAIAFEVDRLTGIQEAARLTHRAKEAEPWDWTPGIERSLVIGNTLYTFSQAGLQGNDLATFDTTSWLAL